MSNINFIDNSHDDHLYLNMAQTKFKTNEKTI